MLQAISALLTALRYLLVGFGKPVLYLVLLCIYCSLGAVQLLSSPIRYILSWDKAVGRLYGKAIKRTRRILEHRGTRLAIGGGLFSCTAFLSMSTSLPVLGDFTEAEPADMTLSTAAIELTTTQSVRAPLKATILNQGFHKGHPGLDLKGAKGDPVYPIMKGVVVFTEMGKFAYGNHVVVDHGGGMQTLYAHLSKIMAKPGDEVTTESVVGQVGSTGNSTGNHLHLEVIDQGRRINPLTVIGR